MSAARRGAPVRLGRRQGGATAVEVALLALVFFLVVFTALELARLIYVYNTLQEVTRRAAHELVTHAPANPDSAEIMDIRRRAIFQTTGDALFMGEPVTVQHVRVDYQSLIRDPSDGSLKRVATAPLPSCAATNRQLCQANPNDPGCVRFVRVRICDTADAASCGKVKYVPAFPLVPLDINLPTSSTVVPAESLGYVPGTKPCP